MIQIQTILNDINSNFFFNVTNSFVCVLITVTALNIHRCLSPQLKKSKFQEKTVFLNSKYRLRAGGDHNVAHEKPEGCPYKSINVRRGNAMRFLVLDHIKEKPVRTKKALLYILSRDKRRAMENIAAQWLFHKVDAYPPEERFYPLHVKPVDDLYYIPEKKVEQMVYVVNKLKKASLESIVSDVTWEESSDEEEFEDYIVDLKTDKLKENADRCEKTLDEIEKYYFEAEDGGAFSPRELGSPVGSEAPYRSIYESHSDTTKAHLVAVDVPAILRQSQSDSSLRGDKIKTLKMEFKRRLTPYTQVTASEDNLTKESQGFDLIREQQYAESRLKNKQFLEVPEVESERTPSTPTTAEIDDDELGTSEENIRRKILELTGGVKKKLTKQRKKVSFKERSSSDEEIDFEKVGKSKMKKQKSNIFNMKTFRSAPADTTVGDTKPSDPPIEWPRHLNNPSTSYEHRPMTAEQLACHVKYIEECKKMRQRQLAKDRKRPTVPGDAGDDLVSVKVSEPVAAGGQRGGGENFFGKYTRVAKQKIFSHLNVIGKLINRN